jgi:hypothetical protein
MGAKGSPKTSVNNYQSMLRNVPAQQSSKTRKIFLDVTLWGLVDIY